MPQQGATRSRVGVNIRRGAASDVLARIRQAEATGVRAAWMTMAATALDTPTIFAAAATVTNEITLGTAIVPAFTRHPLTMAGQALVLEDLAPGRIRLGIGTAHGATMAGALGVPFDRPLARLREYLQVLRPALREGRVAFAGDHYRVDATLAGTASTPILISALREQAFALAGELSDGAISWLCPFDYLLTRARPALRAAAERAGRDAPPLVANAMVVLTPDRTAARTIAREQLAGYAAAPFYARMFADAGYPLGPGNAISDALLDAIVVSGDDDAVGARLVELLDGGLDELLVNLLPGPDRDAEEARLLAIVASISSSPKE